MKNKEKNEKISVIVSETATPKQRKLADWLVNTLTELDVEAQLELRTVAEDSSSEEHHEQSVEDEGKPKTPLSDEEDPSSSEEDTPPADNQDWDDDFWDLESPEERDIAKDRTQGFLIGLFTAWLVTGAGVLILRLARAGLRWFATLTEIPFDVLIGLCMLSVLALFFRRQTQQLTARLIDWFDFDF